MNNLALIAGIFIVVLSPAALGALQGVVYSADGQPSEGATVWAAITYAQPRIVLETTTDAGGCFRVDQLAAGDYTLTVQEERHELYKKQFSLQPGQTFEFSP